MPYFVMKLQAFTLPEPLAEFAAFNAASSHAKALRAALPPGDDRVRIKVAFAPDLQAAQDLLCQVRDARPEGDDE
jgi:hypothetical protein